MSCSGTPPHLARRGRSPGIEPATLLLPDNRSPYLLSYRHPSVASPWEEVAGVVSHTSWGRQQPTSALPFIWIAVAAATASTRLRWWRAPVAQRCVCVCVCVCACVFGPQGARGVHLSCPPSGDNNSHLLWASWQTRRWTRLKADINAHLYGRRMMMTSKPPPPPPSPPATWTPWLERGTVCVRYCEELWSREVSIKSCFQPHVGVWCV